MEWGNRNARNAGKSDASSAAGKEKQALNKITDHDRTRPNKTGPFLVAIGASAGGLEAINELFDGIKENPGCAFVVIQHLSPDYKSLLAELVARHTEMKVRETTDGIELEANTIYIIPTRNNIILEENRLKLIDKRATGVPNNAIDQFFASAAKHKKDRVIGIILSGTGSDGTYGLTEVKKSGGMILVQDPEEARFNGMPNSAASTGLADLILPVREMGKIIEQYVEDEAGMDQLYDSHKQNPVEVNIIEHIIDYIKEKTRHDFTLYKRPTIFRRIQKRMAETRTDSLESYYEHLKQNNSELDRLCRELFINVTRFFRDLQLFELLKKNIIPAILNEKTENEIVKVWVPACSTGEEAYSLAILFAEVMQESDRSFEVKIFATDIVKEAVATAASGSYSEEIEENISRERLDQYFTRKSGRYIITPEIRRMVIFAVHDVVKDPPFTRTDLISCRNMLIYMNSYLQKKVLKTLHYSLNQGGFLVLGTSENAEPVKNHLEVVSRKWKAFRNISPAPYKSPEAFKGHSNREGNVITGHPEREPKDQTEDLFRETLTDEFGYAAIFVNTRFELTEAIGAFKEYLNFPEKRFNLNILNLVSEELSLSLGIALRKVLNNHGRVIINDAMLDRDGKIVNILVRKSGHHPDGSVRIMLIFYRHDARPEKGADVEMTGANDQHARVSLLEQELRDSKIQMKTLVEELETTNEELQSSNEELLSSNEELQSANEELQSLNEELHTINTEHQLRIQELIELNEDLNNYFRSTEIGQIFIDSDMTIRRFTPAVMRQINLIESDTGRSIHHISNNFKEFDLNDAIEQVMKTGIEKSEKVQLKNSNWYQMRIMPYVKQDDSQDGIVITFVDITEIVRLTELLQSILDASPVGILAVKPVRDGNQISDFECIMTNRKLRDILESNDKKGSTLKVLFNNPACAELHEKLVGSLKKKSPVLFQLKCQFGERRKWVEVNTQPMDEGLTITFSDITSRKESEHEMQKAYDSLYKAEENLRDMNRNLEQKVKERTAQFEESEERFRLIANATHDAMWDWKVDGDMLWFNDGFIKKCEAAGNVESIKGIDLKFALVHPDDRKRVRESFLGALEDGKKEWNAEYKICNQDKREEFVLDRARIIYGNSGKPHRVLGAMMDLTELRRAEHEKIKATEKARFLLETVPHKVWTTSPEGQPDYFNKHWEDYTGMTSGNAVRQWSDILHPDEKEQYLVQWKKSIREKVPFSIEHRIRRYDDSYHWHLTRCLPHFDSRHKVTMWICSGTDIDDQKSLNITLENIVRDRTAELSDTNRKLEQSRENLERKVEERTAELREINSELTDFASVVAHDLKAPLRAIGTLVDFVEMDTRDVLKEEQQKNLRLIKGRVKRMSELINGILQYTRIGRREGSKEYEKLDTRSLVESLVKNLHVQSPVRISVGDLPAVLYDKTQFIQVMQNLIENAIKYNDKGEDGIIEVFAENLPHHVEFVVKDNGPGIDPRFHQKVFKIFQTLSARDVKESTGVGLAIVEKIVRMNGGRIWLNPEKTDGAEFRFTVPKHRG